MILLQRERRRLVQIFAGIYILFVIASLYTYIPDEITVTGDLSDVSLQVPVTIEASGATVSETQQVLSNPIEQGRYHSLSCRLFGIIPIKQIQVLSTKPQEVSLVGIPCGIYMRMKGVLVEGEKEIRKADGSKQNPAGSIIRAGDYICKIDDKEISSKEEVAELIRNSMGEKLTFTLLRGEEEIQVAVHPIENEQGIYQLGLWIKDDLSGVGTVTYYTSQGAFGALGHGVSDTATGSLLTMEHGYIYPSDIASIDKGQTGSPGEITGLIQYGREYMMGEISKNTTAGIYGTLLPFAWDQLPGQPYDLAYKQDIQKAEASILFQIENEVRAYQIQIDAINYEPKEQNKSFRFHVTDEELLKATGGIVQGMSGSPIIQNGKFIGAVTHVFVNDPTKGYGIFAETMLEQK